MKYYGNNHKRQGSCGGGPEKCIIYASAYPVSKHQCGINWYSKERGKLCVHIVAWCANCQGNHQANFVQCPFRQKAKIPACKNKTAKNLKPTIKVITTLRSNT